MSQEQPGIDPARVLGRHPSETLFRRALPAGRKLRVGVVGAGVAGLRTADILSHHDVEVTIIEARDRVGGRVGQKKIGGHFVDLGANWLHGEKADNPLYDLVAQTNTQLHDWEEMPLIFDENGKRLSEKDVPEIEDAFWTITKEAYEYSKEFTDSIPSERSLMDFVVERAKEAFSDDTNSEQSRKRRLLLQVAEMWGAFVGGSIQRQSLKFFWLEEGLEYENPFVAETYKKILDAIKQPALKSSKLLLNTEVSAVTSLHEKHCVEVQTNTGDRYSFDEVVVTLPLGCLKLQKNIFSPPLPDHIATAIDAIGYGCLDKVYLHFPRCFWGRQSTANDSNHGGLSEKNLNIPDTGTPLDYTSRSTSHTRRGEQHGVMQWIHPTYASPTNPGMWNMQGINLATLPSSCAHPTLIYYIYGDCARRIASIVTTGPPQKVQAALIDFFKPYFTLLPGYEESNPDCQPTEALATAWTADRLAGYGSYCNFQIGLTKGGQDIEIMRHGVPERRIWLAGEHTAPFSVLGTVTGAYWSGEAVAKRILGTYGLDIDIT